SLLTCKNGMKTLGQCASGKCATATTCCGDQGGPCCSDGTCAPGQLCIVNPDPNAGTCQPCGALNQLCCDGVCNGGTPNLVCHFGDAGQASNKCVLCGASGQRCCNSMSCDPGLTCTKHLGAGNYF